MGLPIILTEDVIREVLNLNDDNNVLSFTRQRIDKTLTQMGYNVVDPNRSISKSGFIKPWQFLVTHLKEPVHGVVQEVPYNFSHYLMKDITSNMWSSKPFLVYPRFMIREITRQLGFGDFLAWYPRAYMVLQESSRNSFLVPTANNMGLVTHLWLFAELIFGVD
ncbi:hypothetical protein Hanom_Chr08g00735431 [Helianthus anomalus]